jgi:hypothetical protein
MQVVVPLLIRSFIIGNIYRIEPAALRFRCSALINWATERQLSSFNLFFIVGSNILWISTKFTRVSGTFVQKYKNNSQQWFSLHRVNYFQFYIFRWKDVTACINLYLYRTKPKAVVKLVVNRPLLDLLNTVLQTRTGAKDWQIILKEFERPTCNRGIAVDYRKSTENNGKRTTYNCEQMEESFDESNGYIVREQQAFQDILCRVIV